MARPVHITAHFSLEASRRSAFFDAGRCAPESYRLVGRVLYVSLTLYSQRVLKVYGITVLAPTTGTGASTGSRPRYSTPSMSLSCCWFKPSRTRLTTRHGNELCV